MVEVNATYSYANYTDVSGIEIFVAPPALPHTAKTVREIPSPRHPFSFLGLNPAGLVAGCTPVEGQPDLYHYVGDPCESDADCGDEGRIVCASYPTGKFCTVILSEHHNCGGDFTECDEGLSCYYFNGPHGLCLPYRQSTEGQWCDFDEHCQSGLTCSSPAGQNGVCVNPNESEGPDAGTLATPDASFSESPDASLPESPDSGPPDISEIGPPIARTLDITGVTLSAEEVEIPGYGPYVDTLSEVTGSMALTFIPESGTVVTGDVAAGGYSSLVGAVIYISAPPGEGLYESPGGSFSLDALDSNASFSGPTTPTGRALVDGASDTFEMVVPVAFSTEDGALSEPPVTIVMSGEALVAEDDFILASPWAVYALSGATLRVEITGVIDE